MKLSVVVPFYNELRTLPAVIDRLLAVDFAGMGLETELIFVDDGSTDASRSLLDPVPRDDVRLIVHERNQGKGAAVKTGLEAATGDILCIQDADLEYHPNDLPPLIRPILDGSYQVVYGNRFRGSAAGLYYSHRVANRMLNLMINLAFNRYLEDVYTGYKVFTKEAFSGLSLSAKTFTVEMELTAHFLRNGLVIYEVPISYRARTYAEGKKIHFKDGFLAAGAVARYRFQRRPAALNPGPAARRAPDVPGSSEIHALGLEDLAAAGQYRRYIHELIAPYLGGSVLEVEARLGDFSIELLDRKRLVLAESDPVCLRALEDRFEGQPRVELVETDPSALKIGPPVDSVVALNVIDLLADDVAALRAMAAVTVPGGTVLLLVPGFPSLAGAFDQAIGEVRRYTPESLSATVTAAGLVPEVVRPVNLLGGVAWWAAVRVLRQARPTPALVNLYDKLVVPAERALERRVQPSFGQSVLCVARVPA